MRDGGISTLRGDSTGAEFASPTQAKKPTKDVSTSLYLAQRR